MISLQINAEAVAWYGAIVSTISVLFSIYSVWRDRARVKIEYQKDMSVINSPNYDPNKKYLSVTVINKGRRPIYIEKAGFRILGAKGKHALFSDSFTGGRNQVLTEEKPTTQFLVKQDNDEEWKRVWYLWTIDGTGREYRKYLHKFPTFWRIWQWIRHRR